MARRAWRPNAYRWSVAPPFGGADDLARQLQTSPLIAQVLHNRGLDTFDAARGFLDPRMTDLYDPTELPGCQAAAERLARAIADGQKIVIYGDYDVDGITATAILHACLRLLGASADFYVPHRLDEGYGVNADALAGLIDAGAELIVTVDCGISAADTLALAAQRGVDVIVTDHHVVPDRRPDVQAIVHPALPEQPSPNPDLCGAGVAFKLAWQTARAVAGRDRVDEPMRKFLLDATCLAALGTIADVMPLVGENRILATYGLQGLPHSQHVGIRALLQASNLAEKDIDAFHVGFVLAPRLNAAGRMGHASEAIEMFTTDDFARALSIGESLTRKNTERQDVERGIAEQAAQMVVETAQDGEESKAIVLACEDWHGGVIGIVASRLVDRFGRPTVLISLDGGEGHGSARSIPGFHMADALAACGEHLLSHGGHAMAGGLKIVAGNVEAFVEAFHQYARQNVAAEILQPELSIDVETTLAGLGYAVVRQLDRMGPFGQGNPKPLISIPGCRVISPPKRMGRNGQAVNMVVGQNGTSVRAVGFGMGDLADLMLGVREVDLVAEPVLNTYMGRTNVELHLQDVRWS